MSVMGTFQSCKVIFQYIKQNTYSYIIIISFMLDEEDNTGMVQYSSPKMAVIGMTKFIENEYALAKGSITCIAMAPTVV